MNREVITHHENQIASIEDLKELAELAKQISSNAKSKNTLNGYASDWDDFESWCKQKGLQSLPAHPSTVAAYLAERATRKWVGPSGRLKKPTLKEPLKLPTLLHRVWGIKFKHREHGFFFDTSSKEIENVMASLRRSNTAKEARKDPLLLNDIRGMIERLPDSLTGVRDKALLLVGFASAMRRSELSNLHMQDIKFVEEGIEIHLNWSKTGQREIQVPYGSNPMTCPVRALKNWLKQAGISEGAVFRSINRHGQIGEISLTGAAIALIVKRNGFIRDKVAQANEKGENVPDYAGHSLRAGFCTHAALVGVPEYQIMAQAGHKKSDTTKKYIRLANKWNDNAAIKLGL